MQNQGRGFFKVVQTGMQVCVCGVWGGPVGVGTNNALVTCVVAGGVAQMRAKGVCVWVRQGVWCVRYRQGSAWRVRGVQCVQV